MPPSVTHESDSHAQRYWQLLIVVCAASTLGLAAAILPLLQQHIDSPWPWVHTQRILLVAFPLTIGLALAYLTRQQRRAAAIHRELMRSRERAAERMERQMRRLSALLDIGRIMGKETSLQAVFDSVTRICSETFASQQVSLMLLDRDAQELEVRAASGHIDPAVVGTRVPLGQGIAGAVAARGEAVVLGPGAADSGRFANAVRQEALASAMVVPILVRDELVGVLNVGSRKAEVLYDQEDLQALTVFAANVGTCIRHTEQAEWMRAMIQNRTAVGA